MSRVGDDFFSRANADFASVMRDADELTRALGNTGRPVGSQIVTSSGRVWTTTYNGPTEGAPSTGIGSIIADAAGVLGNIASLVPGVGSVVGMGLTTLSSALR